MKRNIITQLNNTVAGMTYSDCAVLQAATGFEGEAYSAKLAEMRAIAVQAGLNASSGSLCYLHGHISACI